MLGLLLLLLFLLLHEVQVALVHLEQAQLLLDMLPEEEEL